MTLKDFKTIINTMVIVANKVATDVIGQNYPDYLLFHNSIRKGGILYNLTYFYSRLLRAGIINGYFNNAKSSFCIIFAGELEN